MTGTEIVVAIILAVVAAFAVHVLLARPQADVKVELRLELNGKENHVRQQLQKSDQQKREELF